MADTKLRVERIVDGLFERFQRDVEIMVEAHLDHGRPPWTRRLTAAEKLERFEDPMLRQANLQRMLDSAEGATPEELRPIVDYYEKMVKARQK